MPVVNQDTNKKEKIFKATKRKDRQPRKKQLD